MMDHEGTAKTSAEGNLRFRAQTDFRACDFAGVARNEVINGLIGAQPRNRRHHSRSVTGEEYNVLWVSRSFFRQAVGDVRKRIGGPGVLRHTAVVQVQMARKRVERDVLEYCPEHLGACVNLRLSVRRKANDLRITSVFEVEYSVITPAMLVVADEASLRIGGKGCLAGPREPEEDCNIAVIANVCRTVHGQHAL